MHHTSNPFHTSYVHLETVQFMPEEFPYAKEMKELFEVTMLSGSTSLFTYMQSENSDLENICQITEKDEYAVLSLAPFIGRLPDINQTHRGVEPVEHGERHCHVAQHCPQNFAVHFIAVVSPVVRLYLEGLRDPHSNIADHEEGHQLSTWLRKTQLPCVAATPQTVNDEWRLE